MNTIHVKEVVRYLESMGWMDTAQKFQDEPENRNKIINHCAMRLVDIGRNYKANELIKLAIK